MSPSIENAERQDLGFLLHNVAEQKTHRLAVSLRHRKEQEASGPCQEVTHRLGAPIAVEAGCLQRGDDFRTAIRGLPNDPDGHNLSHVRGAWHPASGDRGVPVAH